MTDRISRCRAHRSDISLRPHQKDAVWRAAQDGTALFDHVVGAGKTIVCVASAMESKRMGLMRKPMFVVPNHLLLQWKDSFYALYPTPIFWLLKNPTSRRKSGRSCSPRSPPAIGMP